MGATGAAQKDGSFPITYKFAVSFSQTNLRITPDIPAVTGPPAVAAIPGLVVPFKPGWFYLWVAYRQGAGEYSLIDVPKAAYVEQVFPRGDFTLLGMG